MLARRPFSPRELLIRHVDFVATFGHVRSLTPNSVYLSTVEKYNIDVYFICLLFIASIASAVFFAVKQLLRVQKKKVE